MTLTNALRKSRVHLFVITGLAVLIAIGPISWMFLTSFKNNAEVYTDEPTILPQEWVLTNYQELAGNPAYVLYARNSVIIAVSSTAFTIAVAMLAAFGFSRYSFKGKNGLFLGVLIARMVPPIAFIVPLYWGVRVLGGMDRKMTLIFLDMVISLPSAIFILKIFCDQVPRQLDDSARIDGCTNLKLLWYVILPLSIPAVAMVTIFTFTAIWNEYLFAVTFAQTTNARTLPVVLANLIQPEHETSWGEVAALTTIAVVPMFALCGYVQRYLVSGVMAGSLKG